MASADAFGFVRWMAEAKRDKPTRTGSQAAGGDEDGADAPPSEPQYLLHISTHTHTPMPPKKDVGVVSDGPGGKPRTQYPGKILPTPPFSGKPRPGITTKDLRLAEKVEKVVAEEMATLGAGSR